MCCHPPSNSSSSHVPCFGGWPATWSQTPLLPTFELLQVPLIPLQTSPGQTSICPRCCHPVWSFISHQGGLRSSRLKRSSLQVPACLVAALPSPHRPLVPFSLHPSPLAFLPFSEHTKLVPPQDPLEALPPDLQFQTLWSHDSISLLKIQDPKEFLFVFLQVVSINIFQNGN